MYLMILGLFGAITYVILKKLGFFESKEQKEADKINESDAISVQIADHTLMSNDAFNSGKYANDGEVGEPDLGIDEGTLQAMAKLIRTSMSELGIINHITFLNDPEIAVAQINKFKKKKTLGDLGDAYYSLYGTSLTSDMLDAYNKSGMDKINKAIAELK